MLFALRLATRRGLDANEAGRLRTIIRNVGLPPLGTAPVDALLERIGRDKKARETGLSWVYPRSLGDGRVDDAIGAAEVEEALRAFISDPWAG